MSTEVQITAPVMRFVGVSDVARSLAFYRDVVGFEEQSFSDEYSVEAVAEVVYGPARLQLCVATEDSDLNSILFFETNDVAGFRDAIVARGGRPSQLEKVNWIKMEMFELRDPDGNILWFGQSFDQPETARPKPMLHQMLPHLPVDDVAAAITHYRDVFGFSINYAQHDLGVMYRDKATLLLIARTKEHSGIGSCTVYIEDADALFDELTSKGANVEAPPVSRPWGLRDFTIRDLEGNRLTLAQPFE